MSSYIFTFLFPIRINHLNIFTVADVSNSFKKFNYQFIPFFYQKLHLKKCLIFVKISKNPPKISNEITVEITSPTNFHTSSNIRTIITKFFF